MNYSEYFSKLTKDQQNLLISNSNNKTLIDTNNNKRITIEDVLNGNIIPRCEKPKAAKKDRTKNKAEVFTPTWVVNAQCNLVDNSYMGVDEVFSTTGKDFIIKELKYNGDIEQYLKSTRLEITCGEAPYLTTRYDMESGVKIDYENRVGFLDRKLKLSELLINKGYDVSKALLQSLSSIYAFEYQYDSLIIARINIFMTILEFLDRHNIPTDDDIKFNLLKIVCTNVFQLDGLSNSEPLTDEEVRIFDYNQNCWISWKDMFNQDNPSDNNKLF